MYLICSKPCLRCGALITGVDPTLTNESFTVWCSVVGWCDPDDELIPLLGSDVLVVVAVGGDNLRASKNSVQ